MVRILAILALCITVCGPIGTAVAQPTQETSALIAQNPLLAQVAQVNLDLLRSLLSNLRMIITGPRQGGVRGEPPTKAELTQIAVNPAFSEAFEKDQFATVFLLRQANAAVAKARSAQ
jgi:hypothetical protein